MVFKRLFAKVLRIPTPPTHDILHPLQPLEVLAQ